VKALALAALMSIGALPVVAAEPQRVQMIVGTHRFTVALYDTPAAKALVQMLPATFEMSDLNDNEKKVRLPRPLPTTVVRPGTIRAGDVLLWGDDTLVVFYKTFDSSYSYTRIGRIDSPGDLQRVLGPADVRVTFGRP